MQNSRYFIYLSLDHSDVFGQPRCPGSERRWESGDDIFRSRQCLSAPSVINFHVVSGSLTLWRLGGRGPLLDTEDRSPIFSLQLKIRLVMTRKY